MTVEDDGLNPMRAVLSTPDGRQFVMEMLRYSGVFVQSFNGDGATEFREGRRSVGLRYLNDLFTIDPGCLTMLLEEENERQRQHIPDDDV